MSFTIEIANNQIVYLKDNIQGTTVEIFSKGALLNKFIFKNDKGYIYNCIDGLDEPNEADENSWFKSAKLSPFVCRLSNASFEFQHKRYKTGKSFSGVHALHGLIYNAAFNISAQQTSEKFAAVTMEYNWPGNAGFPFIYHIAIIYSLFSNNLLSIQTIVTNKGEHTMPLADGWHPYFNMQAAADECVLEMEAVGKIKMNEQLIPTGHIISASSYNGLLPLKDKHFDDCFILSDTNKVCTLHGPYYQVSINAEENYPYLQIFTPDHRQSIAIENLSSVPDAFNNGLGLIILEPGQTKEFVTTYSVQCK